MTDTQLLKTLGRRICLRRKALGLTQEQVAERMNVSVQMISNLELGNKAIRPENLVKISTVLQVSTDYLLFGHSTASSETDLSEKMARLTREQRAAVMQIIDLFLDA